MTTTLLVGIFVAAIAAVGSVVVAWINHKSANTKSLIDGLSDRLDKERARTDKLNERMEKLELQLANEKQALADEQEYTGILINHINDRKPPPPPPRPITK